MKFFRKPDVTIKDRAVIGLTAIAGCGVYGTITDIADKYNVSRPFIYTIKDTILESLATVQFDKGAAEKEKIRFCNELILTMRLCGKSSIEGISETLTILNQPNTSHGYISQYLNSKANCLVENLPVPDKPITVLADEIFVCGHPILVILDACSHLILAIELSKDRTGESWNKCFTNLINKGYQIKKVAKDLGTGLQKGIEGLDIIAQADLFHLLMKFDPPIGSFERRAFGSIEEEERILAVFDNRKSEKAAIKVLEKYLIAVDNADRRINRYDNYQYLHWELHEAFNPFNNDGSFRSMDIIMGDVLAIADLLNEEFDKYEKINDACIFIRKHIRDYSSYVTEIHNTIQYYQRYISDFLIAEVCLAYQNNLKSIAVKDYWKAKKIKIKADEHLNIALTVSTEYQKKYIGDLLFRLNECIRSSSALEAKNSILRKFINSSSGQITQKHLNLISFYMNRKVSIRGKYKGCSPWERYTGIKQNKSFLDILMHQV